MRALAGLIVGLLLGAAVGGALLYYNPLTNVQGSPTADGGQWLLYESPLASNLVLTHGGELPVIANPPSVPELWESTIKDAAVLLVELRNADGSLFGFGTRISMLSAETDLLLKGVGLNTYWTVSVPGRGILFVAEHENIWPLLKEVVLPAVYLSQGWRGTKGYALTVGPLPSGHGLLLGATGEFKGQLGRAAERYELRRYDADKGPVDMSAELGLVFPARSAQTDSPAQPAAQ